MTTQEWTLLLALGGVSLLGFLMTAFLGRFLQEHRGRTSRKKKRNRRPSGGEGAAPTEPPMPPCGPEESDGEGREVFPPKEGDKG